MENELISLAIKNEALRLGFSACGFSKAEFLPEDADRLRKWLDNGYHGSMHYMENHFEKRTDPSKLVEGAKSVVSLLMNYYTDERQKDPDAQVISKYAYGIDYHFVMKDKMKSLHRFIQENFGQAEGRVFVDSAPVLDRTWAVKAGLGWIGKNSNLINRDLGSFVFIGELILDLELEYNTIPESDFCGDCTMCIDACPTDAILPGRTIDSNRCISYLTIENREQIPDTFRGKLENRAFGCDICQDVCPWNRKATPHQVEELQPNPRLLEMEKTDWQQLEKTDFNKLFKSSALKRAGYKGLKRNIEFLT
ncbi:MAG: tRNA epoxyqueuosine(34) reductase QueG [Bacteroidales bacterium]|nr:tRNA epoxyqueuosine(34) reductase QueG [Bacteroidales bacterium]